MPKKYLAITIGPITKILLSVRKTRELWAASYVLSYISRRLIERIQASFPGSVIAPYYSKDSPKGIGVYPDKIYLHAESDDVLSRIVSIKDSVLQEVASWLDEPGSLGFLKEYFRIYIIEFPGGTKNPLVEADALVDTAELRSSWQTEESLNPMLRFFRKVNTVKFGNDKWIKSHLAETDVFDQIRFESLPEISTRTIRNVDHAEYKKLVKQYCFSDRDEDMDDNFIKELQKVLNRQDMQIFKNYHKYVCIVKADGDKVGRYFKAINDNYKSELAAVSTLLYKWTLESAQIIQAYAGIPVYMGGDDILFIAPVVGKGNTTIIELTTKLAANFTQHFKSLPEREDKDGKIIPTLSIGTSISYYKYPLFEALEKARNLLEKSKKIRNASSMSLLKHSGSSFDITLSNDENEPVMKAFLNVSKHFSDNTAFISSIIHHFRENESIYRLIGEDGIKVHAYLRNNFEEPQYQKFVESVADLSLSIYKQRSGTSSKDASESSIKELHSLLRILKFLNGREDDK